MAGKLVIVASAVALGTAMLGLNPAGARADTNPAPLSDLQASEADRVAVAAGVWSSKDGSKVTYEASYFEPYRAVTAADLLRWVPGGAEVLPSGPGSNNQNDKRGFGSGGDQVLINGKRISGKANDIGSAMQRIQAGVVARVEVIRGTTAGLDVRSDGTVFNVILNEDAPGGSGSWQLHSAFYGKKDPDYDGLVSYSNSAGKLNYLLSAQYGPYNRGNQIERYDDYYAPGTDTVIEHRESKVPQLDSASVLSGSGSLEFDNGNVLNVNARIADRTHDENDTTVAWLSGDDLQREILDFQHEDGLQWETGGDLEQHIGPGTLKTRMIYTHNKKEEVERLSLSSTDTGNVPASSQINTDSLATETIVRSSYSFPLGNTRNLELGIEGAKNVLEIDVQLFEVGAGGELTPVSVYNANSDVIEDRYEFFSTHFWQMRPDLVLETALNVESSRITQQGHDIDNERSFTYIKPRIDLRWDLTDATQLRSTLEKTVSQLAFDDFVAGFDNDNDQVDAGNPELEPEKAWEVKFAWERRLAKDNGVVQAQLFYNDIEDHIDNIRVTDTLSAAGNIGDAKNYGIELKGSLRLSTIGIDGAVIDATYTLQDSAAIDPFTGASRKMSNKPTRNYKINFRHDLSQWRFNYNVQVDWNGPKYANDINFREMNRYDGLRTQVGMQYRLTDKLLVWFDTRVLFDSPSLRVRDRYIGNVADGNLLRHEVRHQYFRREYILGLRGQF